MYRWMDCTLLKAYPTVGGGIIRKESYKYLKQKTSFYEQHNMNVVLTGSKLVLR